MTQCDLFTHNTTRSRISVINKEFGFEGYVTTKEGAKLKINELIKKLKALDQHKKGFNEAATKQDFIQLLSEAPGWDFSETDVSKLEHQIDQLVYQLYSLTEDEIKIVENI
jgi:hypothetical protein